jgi:hypothetical protein
MQRIPEGEESGFRDTQGRVMAPCIVMEKGEALDVWIQKSGEKMDMFTGLQARPVLFDASALHFGGSGCILWHLLLSTSCYYAGAVPYC